MTEKTNNKQFEKSARMLLKYGIGKNIEEAREKLRALINARQISRERGDLAVKRL